MYLSLSSSNVAPDKPKNEMKISLHTFGADYRLEKAVEVKGKPTGLGLIQV